MIEGLMAVTAFTLGFWLAYLMGKQAGEESRRKAEGKRRKAPLEPPPPPRISQHKPSCPIRKEWNRKQVCGGCGNELRVPNVKPPTTEWR